MHSPMNSLAGIKQNIRVSIVIVIQDKTSCLSNLSCLCAVLKGKDCEILIIDNASSNACMSYIHEVETDLLIRTISNRHVLPLPTVYNNAINEAEGDYILLYDMDVLPVNSDWLDELVNILQMNPMVGSVSPKLVPQPVYSLPFLPTFSFSPVCSGYSFLFRRGRFSHKRVLSDNSVSDNQERAALSLYCLLFLKSTYLEVNGFDNKLKSDNVAVDFGLKLLQLGKRNLCVPRVELAYSGNVKQALKHLFSTLSQQGGKNEYFQNKWHHFLRKKHWEEKIQAQANVYSIEAFTIAIAVTDHGNEVRAGDYFTAQELASSFEEYGWEVIYLSKKKNEWYKLPEKVDLVLSLLDAYNLNELAYKEGLIKVAWARNWFDRWCENPSFNQYDVVFGSSKKACDYIQKNSRQSPILLPIATSPQRFEEVPLCSDVAYYQSDVCFTGSYWDYPRDIMWGLSDNIINNYKVSVFGAHWEKVDRFKAITKGFVEYKNMPCVYHHTKIVIDDANHVTKPYGAVNSRVFDAIISGALVITNGIEGADELFAGELPSYQTEEELDALIQFYLQNENKRISKVSRLRGMIFKTHTYQHRADAFRGALKKHCSQTAVVIKVPAPSWEEAKNWGDYHMAVSLKKALERKNYRVLIQMLPEWDNEEGAVCDVVIVLRGLSQYTVKKHQINIMWNISHPDAVSHYEYNSYNKVYIASAVWAEKVAKEVSVPVECMLQCTDPAVFFEPSVQEKQAYGEALLFVGNSRKIYRKILKDLLPTDKQLAVYGKDWEGLISAEYVKGAYIPNDRLYRYYGSAKILLNDHWDDMREKGFVSNRVFDGLACGAQILTDKVKGFGELEQFVCTYENRDGLLNSVDTLLKTPISRALIHQAKAYVLNHHTFDDRANTFDAYIINSLSSRSA